MKVALVTGGSRGIGAHLSRGLAAAGWSVVVASRSEGPSAELASAIVADAADAGSDVKAIGVAMDVADLESVRAGVARAQEFAEGLGTGIDLIVNNAGVIESRVAAPWEIDPEEWWSVMEINFRGPFNVVHAAAPEMIRRGGGRIIDLNSGAGAGKIPDYSAYGGSKAALFRFAESVVAYGHDHGLRIFEMGPGVVRTEMTEAMPMHDDREEWTQPEQVVDLVLGLAGGTLDAFTGRYVLAGRDTVESLLAEAEPGLAEDARKLRAPIPKK